MYRLLLCALFALFATSCGGPKYVDYFPYCDSGKPKPKLVLIPVIDSSGCEVPWDLSREISQSVYYEMMNSGELYVMSPEEVGPVWNNRNNIDFFGADLGYTKDFSCADFIVAMELIDHSANPAIVGRSSSCHPCNNVLTMRVRIKVIDVRCACPRVVLYEIITADYTVAQSKECCDFTKQCWGQNGYQMTPCGILHQRMVCKISRRLEEVLWINK